MKRIGLFPNLGKENVRLALTEVISQCRYWGMEPLLPEKDAEVFGTGGFNPNDIESIKSLECAASLGGDGTLLQMGQYLLPVDVPCFGINFGTLGFLAEVDLSYLNKAIFRLAHDNFTIENHSMLRAQIIRGQEVLATAHALNELVLAKGAFSKLAHIQLSINSRPSGRYSSDGLIVSTATGSTAYSLSAGGPLVMPELDVSVITPICAHSLVARALVIPMTEIVELRAVPGSEDLVLQADGETIGDVNSDTYVRVDKSPYNLKFIKLTSRDYYQTWQSKLSHSL